MITVLKVMKHNGELCITRKHEFTVESHEALENERAKLEKHYGCRIYFVRKEKEAQTEKPR